jgi:hypothetical protein
MIITFWIISGIILNIFFYFRDPYPYKQYDIYIICFLCGLICYRIIYFSYKRISNKDKGEI